MSPAVTLSAEHLRLVVQAQAVGEPAPQHPLLPLEAVLCIDEVPTSFCGKEHCWEGPMDGLSDAEQRTCDAEQRASPDGTGFPTREAPPKETKKTAERSASSCLSHHISPCKNAQAQQFHGPCAEARKLSGQAAGRS